MGEQGVIMRRNQCEEFSRCDEMNKGPSKFTVVLNDEESLHRQSTNLNRGGSRQCDPNGWQRERE